MLRSSQACQNFLTNEMKKFGTSKRQTESAETGCPAWTEWEGRTKKLGGWNGGSSAAKASTVSRSISAAKSYHTFPTMP
jgi:hypothetical protein